MKRRKFTSKFKAKVAMEAIKERSTLAELAQKYKLQPSQISAWKKQALSNLSSLFDKGKDSKKEEVEKVKENLYKVIGELKVENDFLKKNWARLG